MRLLIAEEDAALAGFLRRGMESEGYQVQVVADEQSALEAISAEMPDLAVLDLKETHQIGSEVLRSLHASGARLPVLVLTSGADLEARLAFLDQGADDCMFKPFSLQELRARCRALLRRSARGMEAVVQVQDLALDRMERSVKRGERRIKLTNREYALLERLVLEKGRCVTRLTLLERVWGLSSSATNVVDVYINYLRRKLDDGSNVQLIETVRGRGYRIAAAALPSMRPANEYLPGRQLGA